VPGQLPWRWRPVNPECVVCPAAVSWGVLYLLMMEETIWDYSTMGVGSVGCQGLRWRVSLNFGNHCVTNNKFKLSCRYGKKKGRSSAAPLQWIDQKPTEKAAGLTPCATGERRWRRPDQVGMNAVASTGETRRLKTAATRGHKEEHRMNSVLQGATTRRGGTRCARGRGNRRAFRHAWRA
jgi:hypothetical protein